MTGNKGLAPSPATKECCMCGDYGLSHELFTCRSCRFRSQHRYCSDLYPRTETYRLCNWCLREDGGKAIKENIESSTFSSSTISIATTNSSKNVSSSSSGSTGNEVGIKLQRCSFPSHLDSPIKKQRSPESSVLVQKKPSCDDHELLWRARSEEISNVLRSKQVFRGKVRRYKLLEEVSS